jgi:hypothetical protein
VRGGEKRRRGTKRGEKKRRNEEGGERGYYRGREVEGKGR